MLDPSDVFETPITSAEATELKLSPSQFVALDLMLQGSTLVAASRAAGVTRKTLYRWMHHDPKFQAAFNAWQLDAITSARARLLALTDDAVNTVGARLKVDGRLAFSLLKSMGALDRPEPGSTDPDDIEQLMETNRAKERAKMREAQFEAKLEEFGLGPMGPGPRLMEIQARMKQAREEIAAGRGRVKS
jgi:hypothetical protein